jgi:hypothetical protein
MAARLPHLDQVLEDMADVADDAEVDADGLVDRRAVDIDVDLLLPRREGV